MPPTTTIIASPPSDSGYDNGRRVVLDKFHEDSGENFENFTILETLNIRDFSSIIS